MSQGLLPLGFVVYLQGGIEKLMIVGRGIVYQDEEANIKIFVDYAGCIPLTGISPNSTIFFGQESIDRVVSEGFKDEDEERFLRVYDEWLEKVDVPRKEVK